MMVAALLLIVPLTTAITGLGLVWSAATQAANASDAAALGAAVATYPPAAYASPRDAARQISRLNGARLVECLCAVDSSLRARITEVEVEVDADLPLFGTVTVRRSSRAEFDPLAWLGR